jgi:quercetin dioxygenase-like cupin family protein
MSQASKPWIELAPGVRRQTQGVCGQVMQVLVEFAANAPTPEHSHVHEQILYVLEGEIVLTVEGVAHRMSAGQSWALASNVRHGAVAGARGARVLDTFTPLREDLLAKDREATGG